MTLTRQAQPGLRGLFSGALDRTIVAYLGAAAAAAALASALAVAAPLALKTLVDLLSTGRSGSPVLAAAGLYVAALGAQRLAEQGQAFAFGVGEQRLQQRLSTALFDHVLRLPMAFHLDRQAGALVQTVSLGLQGARIILTHASLSIMPVLIQALLIAAVAASIFDAALWLTVALAMAAYAAVFAVGVRRLSGPTRAVSSVQVEATGMFADGLVNVEPVKAFSAERNVGARYQELMSQAESRWREFHARRFENGAVCALVFLFTLGAVLLQGAHAYAGGAITIGEFILLNAYMLQIVRPLEMAGFALRDVAQGMHYLEKWRDLLKLDGEPVSPLAAASADGAPGAAAVRGAPSIRFESVSFSYDEGRPALKQVSFSISAGATLAIVGPSGAGKSSLLRLLMRYYEPSAGAIWIGDERLAAIELDRLRAMIAVVSQDTVLFNASLEDNIRFARPDADEAALSSAICRARLDELVARLPQGLKSMVGERGLRLSGGERQRVAIARAALKDAPILVLDEATSALDPQTEREICAQLGDATHGRTVLIVTHRLALARAAGEIVVVQDGRVIEGGAHAELLAANGVYANLWSAQHDAKAPMGARLAPAAGVASGPLTTI